MSDPSSFPILVFPFPFLSLTACLLIIGIETDVCITLPTVYFFFKETNQKSLEEIDLLFGGRALGMLPEVVAAKGGTVETEKAEETGVSVINVEHTSTV